MAAFKDGRGGALWLMGILVGLIAGYGTLGLRLGISFVETTAFGVTEEHLASTAANLPAWRLILIPFVTGCVIAGLLWLGKRLGLAPDSRSQTVADLLEARAVQGGRVSLGSGLYSAVLAAISLGGGRRRGIRRLWQSAHRRRRRGRGRRAGERK